MANARLWLEGLSDDTRQQIGGMEDLLDDTYMRKIFLAQVRRDRAPSKYTPTPQAGLPRRPLKVLPKDPVGASPEVSMQASPEVSMQASPQVSMQASPQVSMQASPTSLSGQALQSPPSHTQKDVAKDVLKLFEGNPAAMKQFAQKLEAYTAAQELVQEKFEPIARLEDEIPETREMAAEIYEDLKQKKNDLFTELVKMKNVHGVMEYARRIFPKYLDYTELVSGLYIIMRPILTDEREHLPERKEYLRKLKIEDERRRREKEAEGEPYKKIFGESRPASEEVLKPLLDRLEHILENYRRRFALFDVSIVSSQTLSQTELGEKIYYSTEKVNDLIESLYNRLSDAKDAVIKLVERQEDKSNLLQHLKQHVHYLHKKFEGAQSRETMEEINKKAEYKESEPDLESKAEELHNEIMTERDFTKKLVLEIRDVSALMGKLVGLTQMRTNQEIKKMQGLSDSLRSIEMNESFSNAILQCIEEDFTPDRDRLQTHIFNWMDRHDQEISEKKQQLEDGRESQRQNQQVINNMIDELNAAKAESQAINERVSSVKSEMDRVRCMLMSKREELGTLNRELNNLATDSFQESEDWSLPPGSPSLHQDDSSPSQLRRTPASHSPQYGHGRSPQPGPSGVASRGSQRASTPPQVIDLPNASTSTRGGSPTGLNRTVLLTSPTGDPLLVNIGIDPKPLMATEDGERFICDISLNVQEAGNQ